MKLMLRLYRDLGFGKTSRNVPFASSKSAMDNYFNSNAHYTEEVTFNKIGEPIKISEMEDIFQAFTYSYGSIGDGANRIYFFVDNVQVLNDKVVELYYTIDAYATRFFEVSLNEGHVLRRVNSGSKPRQPFSPITMTASLQTASWGSDIFFSMINSQASSKQIFYGKYEGYEDKFYEVESGKWTEQMYAGIVDSDVTGIWVLPISFGAIPLWEYVNGHWYRRIQSSSYLMAGHTMPSATFNLGTPIYTDELHTGGFIDAKGNIVYTVPYGKSVSSIRATLRMSLQSCQLECIANGLNSNVGHIEGMAFNLAGDPLDFYIDSFAEYSARQREYDIQNRDMQSKMAMYKNIGNSLGSGATTGAIGSAGGGSKGGIIGAVAGIGGSIAGSLITRGIDNYYAPKIQALTDTLYQHQADTLSLSGTSIGRYVEALSGLYAFQLSADSYTVNRMNTDLSVNGVYVDETNSNVQSLVQANVPLVCGAISINGNMPSDWKQQIENRILNGVYYKRVA